MKQQSFAACAAVLALAALPAWAGDVVAITQFTGSANTAVVEQVASGGNNQVQIYQGSSWGDTQDGSRVQVVQQGVDFARANVYQAGSGNDYIIRQSDGVNLQVDINVDSYWETNSNGQYNTILVDQSGFDSSIRIDQAWGMHNRAEVLQQGGQNVANIVQIGDGHLATISQSGTNLQALIEQRGGYNNVATIRQGYGGVGVP